MKNSISVIGVGKLGLCTAACLADAGFQVIGVDIDAAYLEDIRSRTSFAEPHLAGMLKKTASSLTLTTDIEYAVCQSDVSFIVVPTPSQVDGRFSNQSIEAVLRDMAPFLKEKSTWHLINVVSTVMPETFERSFKPMIETLTGKILGRELGYAYNPEFIALGSIIENFLNPDFVLVGESDPRSGEILETIYRKTCKNSPPISRTSVINAEIAKLSLNCFCTLKISFANQISELCDTVGGTDPGEICSIIGQDRRVGQRYFMPGLGFGGPCFPRDNEAFVRFAKGKNAEYGQLQQAVININNRQVERAVGKIMDCVEEHGNTVAFLGLAYKPGTPVTERSQALAIVSAVVEHKNLTVRAYDPLAEAGPGIHQVSSVEACVSGAHVAVLLTPWPEFMNVDWQRHMAPDGIILNLWSSNP